MTTPKSKARDLVIKYSFADAKKQAQTCLWFSETSSKFTCWLQVMQELKEYEIK